MIEVKNVSYQYKNGTEALHDINASFHDGEFIAIIGKNGSGKSTLTRLIAGLEMPTSGEILVNGINTKDKKKALELRKSIGIVFQNPENQILFSKVYDDIAFGMKNIGINEDDISGVIEEVLKKVDMETYIQEDPYELSLGQKQRIAIASVLAMNPKILIFDEPTTMLDPKGKEAIRSIAKNLQKEGYTIIYVTNMLEEVFLADRIIVMQDGIIKKELSRQDVIDNIGVFQELGLEVPTLIDIVLKLKENNVDIQLSEFTTEELVRKMVEVLNK